MKMEVCVLSPVLGKQFEPVRKLIGGEPFDFKLSSPVPNVLRTALGVLDLHRKEDLTAVLPELTYKDDGFQGRVLEEILREVGVRTVAACYRQSGMSALMDFSKTAWQKVWEHVAKNGGSRGIVFCEPILAQALGIAMVGPTQPAADDFLNLVLNPGEGFAISFHDGAAHGLRELKALAVA